MPATVTRLPVLGRGRLLAWGAAALLTFLLLARVLWSSGAERRALMRLPAQQRHEAFVREYGVLEQVCGRGPRDDALTERCRTQAEFVLDFPECDADCRILAGSHLPQATR